MRVFPGGSAIRPAPTALAPRLRSVPPGPLFFHHLPGPRQGEGVRWDVLGDGRAGADEGAPADAHRGDELGVAPDEHLVLDDGAQLRYPVEVARDGAGADVRPAPDLRVAQVGEVVRLASLAHVDLLGLDEVADANLLVELGVGTQMRERTDPAAASDPRLSDHAIRQDDGAVTHD